MVDRPFIIAGNDDQLWNTTELIDYLVRHQGQDIKLRIRSEAICLDNLGIFKILDLFEFGQVNIYTENPLQTHNRYNIIYEWSNFSFSKIPNLDITPYQTWNGKKTFLAFYHRPTACRLGLAAYLRKHHKDTALIHFSYETDNPDTFQFFEFDKLASYRKESILEVGEMLPYMPIRVYNNVNLHNLRVAMGYEYNDDNGVSILYPDSLIEVIGETHVIGQTFYPTEKVARPMWLKKPFIAFASKNYLLYLRQMGFKTFHDFWSEDYDGYEAADRFNMLLELIDSLSKKTTPELREMYAEMQPILEHNYQLMKNRSYSLEFELVKDQEQ